MAYVKFFIFFFLINIMKIEVVKSEKKNKRFKAYFIDYNGDIRKTVHFGSASGKTYIDHGLKDIRDAYIARHGAANEDWNNLFTAGALSRWILWGKSTDITKNIDAYNKRLKLNGR